MFEIPDFTMPVWTLIIIAFISTIVQCGYFLVLFSRILFAKKTELSIELPPVSVVICARNELKNLKNNLRKVLDQNYPDFQVVVVNDCSWDDSGFFLKELADEYTRLKIVTLKEQERHKHGKKFALSLGIKAAENDYLLFTDADCRPASRDWIKKMISAYDDSAEIILGYGAYEKRKGLLNYLIRYDTVFNAIQYLSYALAGTPYMGVGRNLSYRRQLFFEVKGFAKHAHLQSGDDDLFVNETATALNTRVVLDPGAFTYSVPEYTFSRWWRQKKRHLTTGHIYKIKHKFLLGTYVFTLYTFFLSLILLLIINYQYKLLLTLYLIRLCGQLVIFGLGMKKLGEKDLIPFIPLTEIVLLILYPILTLTGQFSKNKFWK